MWMSAPCTTPATTPMVVSVGPYSLTTRMPGQWRCSAATCAPLSASPPTMATAMALAATGSAPSSARCEGVSLTALAPLRPSNAAASPCSALPSPTMWMRPPKPSGTNSVVSVRSNTVGVNSGMHPACTPSTCRPTCST